MVAGVMSEIDDAELPMLKWIYSTVDDMLIATGVPKWLAVSVGFSAAVVFFTVVHRFVIRVPPSTRKHSRIQFE